MVFVLTLSLVSTSISAAAQENVGAGGIQTEQEAADMQNRSNAENPEEIPSSGEMSSALEIEEESGEQLSPGSEEAGDGQISSDSQGEDAGQIPSGSEGDAAAGTPFGSEGDAVDGTTPSGSEEAGEQTPSDEESDSATSSSSDEEVDHTESSEPVSSDTEGSAGGSSDAAESEPGSSEESEGNQDSSDTASGGESEEASDAVDTPEESTVPGEEPAGTESPAVPESSEESSTEAPSEDQEQDAYPETDYTGLPTLEELENLPEEEVGATMWLSDAGALFTGMFRSRAGSGLSYWSFDAHYVNQDDPYDVEKNGDFSLKYQMEFHTDGNLEAGAVEIRIPLELLKCREKDENGKPLPENENGQPVIPAQIAVPQVTKEQAQAFMAAMAAGTSQEGTYIENRVTSFNCYIDETDINKKELVFFNYRPLTAGSNAVWQVLYSGLRSMELVDGSEWTLDAAAKVGQWQEKAEGAPEEGTNPEKEWVLLEEKTPEQPMTGRLNTWVKLSGVAKEAYTEPGGSSYTPGLYTKAQIERYTGTELPEKYVGEDGTVNGYRFALWEVRIKGEAAQPWSMKLHEAPAVYDLQDNPVFVLDENGNPTSEQYYGEVVGYLNNISSTYDLGLDNGVTFVPASSEEAYAAVTAANVIERSDRKSWGSRFWIVTAYEAKYVQDGYKLDNGIQVEIIPLDTPEKSIGSSSSAQWGYESYDWTYKGDVIGIEKVSNPEESERRKRQEKEYRSWLEAYEHARKNGGDYGNIRFYSEGEFRGYGYTHVAGAEEKQQGVMGAYKEGTSYEMIMADDIMYAYCNGEKGVSASAAAALDYRDYYYSGVTITQQDTGYDIYEDKETAPNYPQGIDGIGREVYIYAMFAYAEDPNAWELVGTKGSAQGDWSEDGILTYTFDEDTIARKPWRVKAIHRTVEYKTTCNIDVTVCIRRDSPVMEKLLKDEKLEFVQLEDLSVVMGKVYGPENQDGKLLTFDSEDFQYDSYSNAGTGAEDSKLNLKEATKALYGITDVNQLPQRSNAWVNLYQLNKEAASFKLSSVKNDEKNGRALVTYYLTAYDGYAIYDQEAADYLMSTGEVASPGKNAVLFYDLLPEGVYFDPSVQPVAGRITKLDQLKDTNQNSYKRNPDKWNSAQVSVTVDSAADVIENWNGTGRTMVIFHIAYEGADPSVYTEGKWMEGWGLSFRAYYEWKDAKTVQEQYNVSAFMPDLAKLDDPDAQLLGESDEVYADGVNAGIPQHKLSGGKTEDDPDYKVLKPYQLNPLSKGQTNVLYAKCNTVEDIATASASSIEKTLRADADPFAAYDVSAYVGTGAGYTYNVTVKATAALKDIVVYDHLENAAADRNAYTSDPNHSLFSGTNWQGSFLSVETGALTERGIAPAVYYNRNRNAAITTPNISTDNGNVTESGSSGKPEEVLTKANGWYTKEQIIEEYISDKAQRASLEAQKEQWKAQLEEQQGTILKLTENAIAVKADLMAEAYIMKNWGVQSVAVDMSKCADNSEFILGEGDSVSFQIRMEAPTTAEEDNRLTAEQKAALAQGKEIYALNNPSYYSCSAAGDEAEGQTRLGDSVRVVLSDKYIYEVVKEFDEVNGAKVPDVLKDNAFRFRIYRDSTGKPGIANKEYTVWERTGPGESTAEGENQAEWKQVSTSSIATDANGYFQLKAGQKAVFRDMTDANQVKVEEVTKELYWKEPNIEYSKVETAGLQQITAVVTNRYRQAIYVRKDMAGVPKELPEAVCRDFIFRVSLMDEKGNSISAEGNLEWWRVKEEGLSSGTPELWTDEQGNTSHGTIGSDGLFTVPEGAVIALFSEATDARYELEEMRVKLDDAGNAVKNDVGKVVYEAVPAKGIVTTADENGTNLRQDWICSRPSLNGQFSDTGTVRFITNYYRWKDLYLIKTLKNQDPKDCAEPFTFRISKADGSAMNLKDVEWELLSESEGEIVYQSAENAWELWKLDSNGNPERKAEPGDDAEENGADGNMGEGGGDSDLDLLSLDVVPDSDSMKESPETILEGKLIKRVIRETAEDGTETTREVIEFTALCAGRAIRISGLEMDTKYLVEELTREGSFYLPETALQEVTMSVNSASQWVRFVNDYRKRSLTVNKQVVKDSGDAVTTSFEMVIAKKVNLEQEGTVTCTYEPVANQTYLLSGTGISGEASGITDENGRFSLQDGQTAAFQELGVPGEEFVVWEIQDSSYPQVYPMEKESEGEGTAEDQALNKYEETLYEKLPSTGTAVQLGAENKAMLSETGANVRFINGTRDRLLINKEYTGEIRKKGLNDNLGQGRPSESLGDGNQTMFSETGAGLGLNMSGPSLGQPAFEPFEERIKELLLPAQMKQRLEYNSVEELREDLWNGDLGELDPGDYSEKVAEAVEDVIECEEHIKSEEFLDDGEIFEHYQGLVERLVVQLRWAGNGYDVKVRLTVGQDAELWMPDEEDTIICIDQYFGKIYELQYGGNLGVYYTNEKGKRIQEQGIQLSDILLIPDGEGYYTLKPGMLYVLPISGDTEYALTESPESAFQEVKSETDTGILSPSPFQGVIVQRPPQEITGIVKTDPVATLTNEFKGFTGSLITKQMTPNSRPVGAGKPLVWRVEEYDAAADVWKPAAGVEYVVLEGRSSMECNPPERLESTGADGRITLTRSEDGNEYLAVQFVKEQVYLNVQEMTEKMIQEGVRFRVVEMPEESDEDWGVLVGYIRGGASISVLGSVPESLRKPGGESQLILTGETARDEEKDTAEWQISGKNQNQGILLALKVDHDTGGFETSAEEYGMDVPYISAVGFMNSNLISPIEIAKEKLDAKYTGATFTMILYQVMLYKEDEQERTKYIPQAGIEYAVYDTASGKLVEENKFTGQNGEIRIKDGQFARLNLPAELLWAVSEDTQASPDFKLTDLNPKQAGSGSENPFIATEILVPGENLMLIDFSAPTRTIVLTDTVLRDGIEILVDGEWKYIESVQKAGADMASYGRDMIGSGGRTTSIVDRNGDEVTEVAISEIIRWKGLKYKVTGIGSMTFSGCDSLTEITLPDSVTGIGMNAFQGCSLLKEIRIPKGVTNIGEWAFSECMNLHSIVIPPSVRTIGEGAFRDCEGLWYVYFYPNQNREMGDTVFEGCSDVKAVYLQDPVKNAVEILGRMMDFTLYTTEETKTAIENDQLDAGAVLVMDYKIETSWPDYPVLPESWNQLLSGGAARENAAETDSRMDFGAKADSGMNPGTEVYRGAEAGADSEAYQEAKVRSGTQEEGLRLLADEVVPQAAEPSQSGSPAESKSTENRSAASADGVLPENNLPFRESTQSDKKKRQTVVKTADEMRERRSGSSL